MTAALQPSDPPAEPARLAGQRLDHVAHAMAPHARRLIAAVHRRDREATAAAFAAVRAEPMPEAVNPADVLAVVLADRCAGLMLALGIGT